MNISVRQIRPANLKQSLLIILVIYAFVCSVYFVLRFNGLFVEVDTSSQARIIYSALESHSITHAATVYSNGFLYTAVSVFLIDVCGISISTLQIVVYPLLLFLIVFPVFITYRVLTKNITITFLATLLIFCQPDFLFVLLRGSHERFTWTLVLLLIFLLTKTFSQKTVSRTITYMFLFYLCFFALISTNTFFGSSFVIGLALTFAGGYLLLFIRGRNHLTTDPIVKRQIQRQFYLATSSLVILYFFMFYLYIPTYENLRALKNLADQLLVVLLGEEQAFNPYSTFIDFNWISSQVYLLLTAFSWIILGISAIVWLREAVHFVRQKVLSEEHIAQLFLWLMYAAFGTLLVASVFADRTDALTGDLQVRIFPPVMLFAIPIATMGIWPLIRYIFVHPPLRWMVAFLAVPLIAWFSFSSVMKASMEPAISDKFLFTTVAENTTGDWLVKYLPSGSLVWTGLDERVVVSMYYHHLGDLQYETGPFRIMAEPLEGTNYYMFSTTEKLRWLRNDDPVPYFGDDDLAYDNGSVQVYHRRPHTPYQQ